MILRLVDRRSGKKSGLEPWDLSAPWPDLRTLVEGLGKEDWHVDLVLVDDRAMAELNGDFRGKPDVTDVLSFSYLEDEGPGQPDLAAYGAGARHDLWWADPPSAGGAPEAVGEVILAPRFVADRTIHIDGLRTTMTDVLVRVERLDGTTLVNRVEPSQPSLVLVASPSLSAVAGTYLDLGVEHILLGIDHLLFVLALLMLVKGRRRLVGTITAFTVAHSVTLAAASLGWVNVPGAPVEAVIALSIVFVAAEIVHGQQGREGVTARAPWIVALVFGLLHGFGFAGALHEVGLPGHAIPLALLLFNVGVEVGQLLFVAAVLTLLAIARRPVARSPRWAALAPAYAIGAVATFWTLQRVVSLG